MTPWPLVVERSRQKKMAELEVSVAACRVSYAALRYCFLATGCKDRKESCVVVDGDDDGANGTTQVL